ncbi:hypothetical protein Mp_3g16710 [Marchantia polymorpha subsp. ruderalis]|uniref:Leucine-rich repeat-containing N-terminal plant-type domain-containing protein n=2 Tax=Marchantia polymorpha TaxID=3197 RepID=A0AAF6B1K3_MARPO|nr:hypothetical protein MARPO_0363s0001 [Marchantia polymorpha]BBN05887.1 hypothetical protein Mp_3g16710 [Marchantia polymorpha subsp. ruderalis]|eukprot:PTQ26795.1 hypothetical protein MARPO_0363s0001 [Marchantia polymorpha]
MAPGHLIVLLACFLLGSSVTVCMGENWPSEASSSLSHQSISAESERTFIQSRRKGQLLSDESLHAAEFKEMDLDHPDHRGLQLHASKIDHIREGFLHYHETDSRSHGFSQAVSLLEVSFGEADALLAVKDGIGNYSGGALDDWTPDKRSEYCSWTRVTCNCQLHVTALNLSSLDLTGLLGPSLCNLTYLEELHLDQNFLQSEIPPELGRLSRLRILNLEENWLYGSIPKEIGNLTSLQILNLGSQGSFFNGMIPEELGQLSELRFLNLGAVNNWDSEKDYDIAYDYDFLRLPLTATNELRGTIPRSIGNCTKLWYLDFYGNGHLTGVIPEELGKLLHLKYLSFEWNNFTGVIPEELGKLVHLEYLSFTRNNFTGAVPYQLGNLTRCKYLNFGFNALQGHLPVGLANLSRLVILDVRMNFFTGNLVHVSSTSWSELLWLSAQQNLFTGKFPELLLSCHNLVALDLSGNNFSGNLPADLGRLSSAKFIYIDSNRFGGELPESLTNISLLTYLDLFANDFTGPLDALGNSTLLEYLSLGPGVPWLTSFNSFTGRMTDEIVRSWPKMKYMDLSYNALTGKIPRALGNLTELMDLNLQNNKFNGGIAEEFGDLQNLKGLELDYNELTGKIPASLANLQDVQRIHLGGNNLTGAIPEQFGNLTKIRSLRLHMNYLTGKIPPDLGKLQNLAILYLHNNNLTGSIPVTLNNCSAMWSIRLSHNSLKGHLTHINFSSLEFLQLFSISDNKFSGVFPITLWNCSNLEWLDLSSNHLSGLIPKFEVLNAQPHQQLSQWDQMLSQSSRGLRVLSLRSNYFSGSIPSSIWKLPALHVLDLSSNSFTGVLPPDLSGLETYKLHGESKIEERIEFRFRSWEFEEISLRKGKSTLGYMYLLDAIALLDVSSNQLTGKLPAELGTLQGLTNLFMNDNNFEGSIPAELGEIVELLELDLSRNQLSGPIPMSLSRLRLSYLNLSLNQLCGPIPVANSFDTRSSGSFQPGNPKLCGDSINKSCESSTFSCGGELDVDSVTERAESWSLYFHGVSMTAFAIGASVGFSTVIGLVTLIPTLRNRFLFSKPQIIYRAQSDYGLFRRPS